MRKSAAILGSVIAVLVVVTVAVWSAAWHAGPGRGLKVAFLDVGQGDAILIQAPSGRTALVDGGPDSAVLRRLGEELPWYERSLDVIVPTHPDADHIAGLVGVLARYRVGLIVKPGVEGDTATAAGLGRAMTREGTREITVQRGQIIDLGGGVYLEVLSPDRPLPHAETNTACTVIRLVYGKTAFLLDCDAPQAIENYLVHLDGKALHADVLKAGHHGSRTSSSPLFVGYVGPQWSVFSRGCGNKYGFPHQETIDTMARFGIPVADTCTEGTVRFRSDGQTVSRLY